MGRVMKLQATVLESVKEILGEQHPNTLTGTANLTFMKENNL